MAKRKDEEFPVFGISPLGGNSVEGTADGFTPVSTTEIQQVPLVYDARVGCHISKLAQIELNDRDISLQQAKVYNEEQEFNAKAGYEKT